MVKSTDGNRFGEVIKTVINMINYIKTRPIKCTLFKKLCQEMDAEHKILLLDTEIRCLSRDKILNRVLEFQDEVFLFFKQKNLSIEKKIKIWFGVSSWLISLIFLILSIP
jgi:hypothetical protein